MIMNINRLSFYSFLASLFFIVVLSIPTLKSCAREPKNSVKTDTIYIYSVQPTEKEWETFIKAVIHVESRGNKLADSGRGDIGVLQLREIYVDEVNRIIGESKYSYEDRKDSLKSIEMFNVMQEYYNPTKCFKCAIKNHNPHSQFAYERKIMEKYDELMKKNQ